MKVFSLSCVILLAFSVVAAQSTSLKVGDTAPDFELPNQDGDMVRLSDFRGKSNVVLAFYVLAFTGG
jgi:peroxiredoxin